MMGSRGSSSSGGGSAPRPRRRSDPGDSRDLSVATTTESYNSERSVGSSSAGGGGGRGIAFLDAFRSCFVSGEAQARSPETSVSDDFHPSQQLSQSISSQGSSSGSNFERRRSIKGLYNPMHRNSSEKEIPGSTQFSLPQIQKATKNFSPNLKIGQGGSGTVYKGQLNDGTLIAVKRAKKNVYDKHMGREFRNEIETLQCIEHLNLVRFHGYLEFGGEQLIIVEYVPNGNLREHLDCKNPMIQLNEKSDVYSFGVLLVELITGRRPIEPRRAIVERVTGQREKTTVVVARGAAGVTGRGGAPVDLEAWRRVRRPRSSVAAARWSGREGERESRQWRVCERGATAGVREERRYGSRIGWWGAMYACLTG